MPDYDIEGAFRAIENELLDSMIRNLKHHRAEETDEGFEWTSWQTEQLNALNKYKSKNNKVFKKRFAEINSKIEEGIRESKKLGSMDEEISILDAIKKGFKATKQSNTMQAQFFKVNERKLDALIKATKNDMQKAETAMLRMANDQYRKVIFNAQVYANTGAGTYEQAVDMATKDFLSRGINCVEYKNGARVNIASYAAMAIRTANTRAYLQGEGEKRQEWGISTVIVNKRGNPCLKCLKWVGKVLIDDVWSGGKASDGPYPLMSTAMAQGLYHPNCKDGHTTFFPGITEELKPLTRQDIDKSVEAAREEQKTLYAQRQADRFQRLADYSLDEEDKKKYSAKAKEWGVRAKELGQQHIINTKQSLQQNDKDDIIKLKKQISDVNAEISNLKKQFSDITEGYSYDEWFSEFGSIEEGFGDITDDDLVQVTKLKDIDSQIREATANRSELLLQKKRRTQLDTGYTRKIPDDELEEYNKKAFEQIKLDTGYSDEEATEFHNALLNYFGGDYETILSGETETAKIIKNGIDRMPTYDGSVYRGMTFTKEDVKQFTKLKEGYSIPSKGIISSWSSDNRVATSFGGVKEYERSTVILECVDNQTGVGVQHISKFGTREAEVLSSADYEVVEVVIENKYDYLSQHKELLYFPDDLEEEAKAMKENVVCRIKVKEKN